MTNECQTCNSECNLEVHHITYELRGEETLDHLATLLHIRSIQLQPICQGCCPPTAPSSQQIQQTLTLRTDHLLPSPTTMQTKCY